jgi:ornithine carbamoyltransferase
MNSDRNGLKELEQVCLANNARYKDWEYNEQVRKLTRNADALYMHCLPADISGESCAHGEVSKETFERYRIQTYLEAGYKPYIIAAMMLTYRYKNSADILSKLLSRNTPRAL